MLLLEIFIQFLFEFIGHYVVIGIQHLGALIRWIPYSFIHSYSEVKQWNGNTRLGFAVLCILLTLYIYNLQPNH